MEEDYVIEIITEEEKTAEEFFQKLHQDYINHLVKESIAK